MKIAINYTMIPREIKTKLYSYRYNLKVPEQKTEYKNLCTLFPKDVQLFAAIDGKMDGRMLPDREVILETEYIFGNQWNTKDGFRVFNWYESICPNKDIKTGHYLCITAQMQEVVSATYKCGYCGAQYYGHENEGAVCTGCLGSSYLKPKDFILLQVQQVKLSGSGREYPDLPDKTFQELLALYKEKQTMAMASNIEMEKEKVRKRCQDTINRALEERDGLLWFLNHGISIENVIYYSRSGEFCIGWREPIAECLVPDLEKAVKDAPFKYRIKVAKGG